MRQALDKKLRSILEKTVVQARDIAEAAAIEALNRLGVDEASAPGYLKEDERKLRNKLRAHGRQLGDLLVGGKQQTTLLVNEMAYQHWHRMIFARFLEQSDLLMYDQYTPLTIEECHEIAPDEGAKDGWELAGRLAAKMLPQVFRVDSPVFEVKLASNRIQDLEALIGKLDPQTFQASDALGWLYQFWQTKRKDEVNKSEVKIGARELSPVTQLFTEPYMVSFLLDNALGAWWANKVLTLDDLSSATTELELRQKASITGVPLEYLRFVQGEDKEWTSVAGTFEQWPNHLSELKTLDPCSGSGHFLVATFLMLVPMRMQLEELTATDAVNKVLAENIHGLELDQRCVELAAFALALEAWRFPDAGGYRPLPELQLACSGLSIEVAEKEWSDIANGDDALIKAINWMQNSFKHAPTLGSLINPRKAIAGEQAQWQLLQQTIANKKDASNDAKVTVQGLAKAADLLSDSYQWVITNVPYLSGRKQSDKLKSFCVNYYDDAKNDLAAVFVSRCKEFLCVNGTMSLVTPQSWLFKSSYTYLRKNLLEHNKLNSIARLGTRAFETISGEVVNTALISISKRKQLEGGRFSLFNVATESEAEQKALFLKSVQPSFISQKSQLENPGHKITGVEFKASALLSEVCNAPQGIKTGDDEKWRRRHWEVN